MVNDAVQDTSGAGGSWPSSSGGPAGCGWMVTVPVSVNVPGYDPVATHARRAGPLGIREIHRGERLRNDLVARRRPRASRQALGPGTGQSPRGPVRGPHLVLRGEQRGRVPVLTQHRRVVFVTGLVP